MLLFMMIYVASICFTQMVAEFGLDDPAAVGEDTDAFRYYGALWRSGLSLYQAITGGVSWGELLKPFFEQNSSMAIAMVVLFCVYISFGLFAMLNVITGVFVESALSSA